MCQNRYLGKKLRINHQNREQQQIQNKIHASQGKSRDN